MQDALHEDLNRYTKYSSPSSCPPEEAASNTVTTVWRKFTGQSGKRVVTLHVAPNASASASAGANVSGGTVSSDKEKVKEAVPPTAVTASIASESTIPIVVTPPVPLSLQVIDNASMNFNLHKLVVTYLTLVCLE